MAEAPGFAAGPAIRFGTAMAIAGTVSLFVKESGVGAVGAVFWRCAFGFLVMLPYCWWFVGFRGRRPDRRDAALIGLGGVFLVLNWVMVFGALDYISITLTSIVYQGQSFFVLALVWLLHRERTSLRKLAWVAVAFLGLVLAIGFDPGLVGDARSLAIGVALTVGAAFWQAATLVATRGVRRTPPELITLAHTLIGLVLLAPIVHPDPAVLQHGATALWLIGLGVLHTGLVYVMMYGAYPRLTGAAIAVLAFSNPASAILTDAAVYGTAITPGQVVGLVAIAVATLCVRRS